MGSECVIVDFASVLERNFYWVLLGHRYLG